MIRTRPQIPMIRRWLPRQPRRPRTASPQLEWLLLLLLSAPALLFSTPSTGASGTPGESTRAVARVQAVEQARRIDPNAPPASPEDEALPTIQSSPVGQPSPPMVVTVDAEQEGARRARAPLARSLREMVSFDLASRVQRVQVSSPAVDLLTRSTEGAEGDFGDPDARVFRVDDYGPLGLITGPEIGNYPKHVKIKMQFMDENGALRNFSCSGTLIDPQHVLTAGHCVYAWDDGQGVDINAWALSVTVFPGYDQGDAPWGGASAVQLHAWTGWTEDEDYDADVALIDLNQPIGAITGWRGYGTSSDCDFFEGGVWTKYSYPGEIYSGERMYAQQGTYDGCETNAGGWYGNLVDYDTASYKGQSGSSGVRNNVAWAVTSHSTCALECGGRDIRIDPQMFGDIGTWLEQDKPATLDLVALDMNTNGASVFAGNQASGVNFLVTNYSKASYNGSVSYDLYLSTNTTISTSDIYVTSGGVTWNAAPLASARVSIPNPTIPFDVPPGNYFMGVIIDFPTDANASNSRINGAHAAPITVKCPSGGVPQPAFPENGHPCVPTNITLNWGSTGSGVTYQVEVGRSPWLGSQYTTTSTQILISNLLPGVEYFWRVRARTTCGSYGAWSSELYGFWSFITEGLLDPPALTLPGDGAGCLPASANLDWNPAPHAASYRIQFGTTCGSGSLYTTTATSYTVSGLLPGTRYWWRVRGVDACGHFGPYSACRSFVPAYSNVPAPSPGGWTPGECFHDSVLCSWHKLPGSSAYELEIQNAVSQVMASYSVGTSTSYLVTGLPNGQYGWRVRAQACLSGGGEAWGGWSAPCTFNIDQQGPALGAMLASTTHGMNLWSRQTQVTVVWDAATDGCSVADYLFAWDQSPSTVPDGTNQTTALTATSPALPDGQNHWFHLVARDNLGNTSAPRHLGPFFIDTTPPPRPQPISTPPYNEWIEPGAISISWPAVQDAGSGVAGYSFTWSTTKLTTPDGTIETTGLSSNQSLLLDGVRFFRVAAVDQLGNVSTSSLLPFMVDTVPPALQLLSPNGGEHYLPNDDVADVYFNVSDELSGMLSLALAYTVNAGNSWYPIATLDAADIKRLVRDGLPYQWALPWVPPGSSIVLRLTAIDEAGNITVDQSDAPFTIVVATGVQSTVPVRFELADNAPNPFNPRTTIRYALPASGSVDLAIFDQRGRRVRTLVRDWQVGPARFAVEWDGTDDKGRGVVSGVFYYRLIAGEFNETKRMALVR